MSLELDSLFMRAFLFWGLIEREKARIEKNYEEVREIPSGMGSDVSQQLHVVWAKMKFTSHWHPILSPSFLEEPPTSWLMLKFEANQSHHFSSRKFDPSMMPRCRPQNSEMSTQMPCWFESCRCNTLQYPAKSLCFAVFCWFFTIL